ncbi:MAG: tetratricopeptide repeat protein [Caldilineaceae bacterium]
MAIKSVPPAPASYLSAPPFYARAQFYLRQGQRSAAAADFVSVLEQGGELNEAEDYNLLLEFEPTFAAAYFLRGQRVKYSEPEQAVADYQRATEFDPTYLAAYQARASFYDPESYEVVESNPEAALAAYQTIVTLDPNNVAAYAAVARLNRTLGNYAAAVINYTGIIARFPHYFPAYYERGQTYQLMEEYERALADYTSVIDQDPENAVVAYHARAQVYQTQGETALAQLDAQKALQIDQGRYGPHGSLEDFTRAIEWLPDLALAYIRRADLYADPGSGYYDAERAVEDYTSAIALEPENASTYSKRALLYQEMGLTALAEADFSRVIELDPQDRAAYKARAELNYLLGDFARALADYDFLLQSADTMPDFELYKGRAQTHTQLEDYPEAIADYTTVISLTLSGEVYSGYPTVAYYSRAHLFDTLGKTEQALQDFKAGLAAEDYIDGSLRDYNRLIELDPAYAPAYFWRGRAYLQASDQEKAIKDFQRVLELTDDSDLRGKAEEQLQNLGGVG